MKKFAISIYAAVTVALLAWGFYQAIYIAPADDRLGGQGELYRIIFYHVPSAMVAFLFFAISLAGSIGYLSFRRSRDAWAQISDAWPWPEPRLAWSSAPWCSSPAPCGAVAPGASGGPGTGA